MNLPATFEQDEWGLIHVSDHRITLDDLIRHYQQGESLEMLQARFPTLNLEQCGDAIQLYETQSDEVDAYMKAGHEQSEHWRTASRGRGPTLEELRKRRESIRLAPVA